MGTTILILGDEGRLRDGLRAILLSFSGIDEVRAVENLNRDQDDPFKGDYPSLIIVDGSETLRKKCADLKELSAPIRRIPCIIVVNSLEQWRFARDHGASAVLIQGFSTITLQNTLIDLSIISAPDPTLNEQISEHLATSPVRPKQSLLPS